MRAKSASLAPTSTGIRRGPRATRAGPPAVSTKDNMPASAASRAIRLVLRGSIALIPTVAVPRRAFAIRPAGPSTVANPAFATASPNCTVARARCHSARSAPVLRGHAPIAAVAWRSGAETSLGPTHREGVARGSADPAGRAGPGRRARAAGRPIPVRSASAPGRPRQSGAAVATLRIRAQRRPGRRAPLGFACLAGDRALGGRRTAACLRGRRRAAPLRLRGVRPRRSRRGP